MTKTTFPIIILLFALLSCPAVPAPVQAADTLETVGDVFMMALPVAAIGMTVGLKDWQGTFQLGASSALSLGVTYGLKYAVDAKRPNGEDHSFPSAHASLSFTAAEFMRKRYGWEYGLPAYLAAAFVAYSRVEADQHYTRDVIAGAAIGIASGYLFSRSYGGWHIQPDVGHASYYGLRLSHNW